MHDSHVRFLTVAQRLRPEVPGWVPDRVAQIGSVCDAEAVLRDVVRPRWVGMCAVGVRGATLGTATAPGELPGADDVEAVFASRAVSFKGHRRGQTSFTYAPVPSTVPRLPLLTPQHAAARMRIRIRQPSQRVSCGSIDGNGHSQSSLVTHNPPFLGTRRFAPTAKVGYVVFSGRSGGNHLQSVERADVASFVALSS